MKNIWIKSKLMLAVVLLLSLEFMSVVYGYTYAVEHVMTEQDQTITTPTPNGKLLWQGEIITPSNQKFTMQKMIDENRRELTLFIDEQGRVYSEAEFYANFVTEEPKLDPELESMLNSGNPDTLVPIIVILADQPQYQIAKEVRQKYLPLINEHKECIRTIFQQLRSEWLEKGYSEYEDSTSFCEYEIQSLTEKQKQTINESLNATETLSTRMRKEFYNRSISSVKRASLVNYIESLEGQVKSQYIVFNALSANIALKHLSDIADRPEVAKVIKDRLEKIRLDVSVPAIYADDWWDLGYDGGAWDIGIVDTGVDDTHPALNDHPFLEESFVDGEDTNDYNGHGTHLAGIVASTDDTYRGVAYGLNAIINAKALDQSGAGWRSDIMEAVDYALFGTIDDADVINYSVATDGSAGSGDDDWARFWDAVVYHANTIVTTVAGNAGAQGVELPGTAYNVITVAASDDHGSIDRSDDTLTPTSGRGPTGDGRRKPDITAPGSDIMSCNDNWEDPFWPFITSPDFVEDSGTSMAAPHVAGACLLLLDYGIVDPLEMRALLINTARKRGFTGWDNGWGWGYIDLRHALWHRTDVRSATIDDVEGNDYLFYEGAMFSGDTATLVWNRHAEYNATNYPTTWYTCSDIDLELWDESAGTVITGSYSRLDNIEQVAVGSYYPDVIVKIEAFGLFDSGVDTEDIALATEENFQRVQPPSLEVSMNAPTPVQTGQVFGVSATVTNNGEITVHNVEITLSLPWGLTLVSGSNPQNLGSIASGSSKTASWQVRADYRGYRTMTTAATSNSYAETFTASGSFTVVVHTHDVAVTGVAPSPVSVRVGEPVTITVDVWNQGDYTETFDVTAYYDSTAIETQIVSSLAAGASTTLTFIWDTTGVPVGDYTIKAVASTVPGETDTYDNTRIDGVVYTCMPGQYVLIIQADSGGTTSPSPGAYRYDLGTSVTVTASTYTNYAFDYWTLDGDTYSHSSTTSVTMDSDHTLKAWFHYTGSTGCVAEGTLVTMADGTSKPVEEIKKGDQVLGFDPTTGSYMAENVLDTIKHQVEVMVNINNGMLKLTPTDQPVFIRNATYEGWVRDPETIQVGWEIFNATSGSWVSVTSTTIEEGRTRVYDLVLDGYTTYIANGILLMDKC